MDDKWEEITFAGEAHGMEVTEEVQTDLDCDDRRLCELRRHYQSHSIYTASGEAFETSLNRLMTTHGWELPDGDSTVDLRQRGLI